MGHEIKRATWGDVAAVGFEEDRFRSWEIEQRWWTGIGAPIAWVSGMFLLPGQEALHGVDLIPAGFRLLVAVLLGGLLGWNREKIGKPAGLRTHIMVSLGSCLFLIVGAELLMGYSSKVVDARLDPTRVLQGVVGGIGFLGAGSIIQSRGEVQGVTTAASIWVTGAIGAGCGLGYYYLAALVAVLAFVTLHFLARLEGKIEKVEVKDDVRFDQHGN